MENIGLIKTIAQSFHHTTGLDFDDLFQEASLAYLHALRSYDPKRGKITTYMWVCMTSHLKNYLKEEYKHIDPVTDSIEDIEPSEHPITVPVPFWESLSRDTQEIADMILKAPRPFIKANKTQVQRRVRQVMHQRGWDNRRIRRSIQELKLVYF
jgi:RNA polymerase sigma factor (sigma-70 family)